MIVKKLLIIAIWTIALGLGVVLSSVFAGKVQLGWNANTESDLAGYRLYVSETVGVYDTPFQVVTVSPESNDIIITLDSGKQFSAVLTAFDIVGNESGHSNEVIINMPVVGEPPPVEPDEPDVVVDVTPPAIPQGFKVRKYY